MQESRHSHVIASYVAASALTVGTRAAQRRLGYELLPAVMQGRWEDASWRSDLRLVDERHVSRVPRDATPVVVLAQTLAPRIALNLSIALPRTEILAVRGKVCEVSDAGTAVEFAGIDDAAQRAIADFVQRRLAVA